MDQIGLNRPKWTEWTKFERMDQSKSKLTK